MSTVVSPQLAKRVATELLVSFHDLKNFEDAEIGELQPIYGVVVRDIAFYEVKFRSKRRTDCGYAIVSATESDLPVVEFSEKGKTHFERFAAKVRRPFRMVRFGPTCMAAEARDGSLLAKIGELPLIMPEALNTHIRGEENRRRGHKGHATKAVAHTGYVSTPERINYQTLKSQFVSRPPSADYVRRQWAMAKSHKSPCLMNYIGVMRPDIFERGHTDVFHFQEPDAGDLTSLRIRHDDAGSRPGWFLEDIRVRADATGQEWIFPCSRWLARDEDDGRIDRILTLDAQTTYTVFVRTGDRSRAGTDANVFVTLSGSRGTSATTALDHPGHNDFERGQTDSFAIRSFDLGALTRLRVLHDNTGNHPGWFLEDIRVRNESTGQEWLFPCSRWLAADEDDGLRDRTLTLDRQVQYTVFIRTGDVSAAGTDANVHITINGVNGSTPDVPLDNPGHDDFERGQIDRFTVSSFDLDEPTSVRIGHDNSGKHPGWFLEDVRIRHEGNGREWLFPCSRWLAKDESDGRTERTLTLEPQTPYGITVRTGDRSGAGTDANLYLTLAGANGATLEMTLDNPGRDDFERGQTDTFSVVNFDLGELTSAHIRHDNSGRHPGWFLEDIRVRNGRTGQEWLFPCSRWLATDEDDGRIARTLTHDSQVRYRISITTGTQEGAGTDANVYLTLFGTQGTTPEVELDNPGHDDFERGHTDLFVVPNFDLGEVTRVRIRHDNSGAHPGWFLSTIVVQNDVTGRSWSFDCDRWLATDEDDQSIDRMLVLGNRIAYTVTVRTGDRSGAGTDANVFLTVHGSKAEWQERLVGASALDDSHRTYFVQIDPQTGLNNNDHSSGCGPTAWMNLFGWHDLNWTGALLNGSPRFNYDADAETLTMELHDYLGTSDPPGPFGDDQGFTWPDDMNKGLDFARSTLGHDSSSFCRDDWFNTDEDWVFEVARRVARAGRPFIVGYFQDWHYGLGYEIAECSTHGWKAHSWLHIYPGWSENDSDDKWIPKSTIFAVYGVYDFH